VIFLSLLSLSLSLSLSRFLYLSRFLFLSPLTPNLFFFPLSFCDVINSKASRPCMPLFPAKMFLCPRHFAFCGHSGTSCRMPRIPSPQTASVSWPPAYATIPPSPPPFHLCQSNALSTTLLASPRVGFYPNRRQTPPSVRVRKSGLCFGGGSLYEINANKQIAFVRACCV